jgi:RNA polymerase sigma-70 factor (ECF subfamily)
LSEWGRGDEAAGETLVRRHFATIHRFLRGKVNEGVADDLVQRSFLIALERRDRFREGGSLRAFVLGIARLELFAHYRHERRAQALVDPSRVTLHDLGTAPPDVLERRDDRRLLARALQRLPLDLQIALELHYWENLSSFEIAEVLAIPAPTARSRIARARELLEGLLAELAESPDELSATRDTLSAWARGVRAGLGDDDGAA